jgi:hypothetical protein
VTTPAYGSSDSTGAATAPSAAPTSANFLKWAGAFGVYAIVVYLLDESEKYGTVVEAMAWLVATTAFLKWYKQIGANLSSLTGVAL